ncbi:hypothetical protein [Streptomyces sp. P17]|uniref:hypothetical protein n=1 Tax=Streptomyces sp. P17 TaxID=3074716 RepID=UPI0028F41D38|nr:hypothetical protein [Streptomyces sp. P17]MDT9700872.1 hypothetical protein [Streptomyces sp. P17]
MRPSGVLARCLRRPIGVWPAVYVTVGVLALTNVAGHRWGSPFGPLTAVAVSALLLGGLWWAGGTWAEAGLDPASFRRGARWAGVLDMRHAHCGAPVHVVVECAQEHVALAPRDVSARPGPGARRRE